jgi:CPA1 family monovalent cation:H+ antiporter
MGNFLTLAVLLLLFVVLLGFFNEKVTNLTYEISLMLYSVIAGGVLLLVYAFTNDTTARDVLEDISLFNIEDFLMDGVLCFMLFAGSCHMKLKDFVRLKRQVGVLAFLCTFLGALFYGFLFYGASCLLNLSFSLPMCLMFGSIVAPTDPIAATSILNKFGLPKDTGFLVEGESLLNDGVGVALFVCFSSMVTGTSEGGFFSIMIREIAGALIIGSVVTFLFFLIFRYTVDENRRIFISLLMVSLAYVLCEIFSCSGAIASVVCGVLFSTLRHREEKAGNEMNLEHFDSFWGVIDCLLNSVLYVILGLSFIRIMQMPMVIILSLIAIICNFAGRFSSLFVSTFFMGELPDGYGKAGFSTLFTWGGLRGGLCIALAMSASSMVSSDIYHIVLGCTYAIVFFTTVIQGLTMKKVYEKIRKGEKE